MASRRRHYSRLNAMLKASDPHASWRAMRAKVTRRLYRSRKYDSAPATVRIVGSFGIEQPEDLDHFVATAGEIIDQNTRVLTIDIVSCSRVWPSGVTFLASLAQHIQLTGRRGSPPRIRSTASKHNDVNRYLDECGFYDYVGRPPDVSLGGERFADVVKIRRENRRSDQQPREQEICTLLRDHSFLDDEGVEWFDSVVLTELLGNVTEHGIPHQDRGWWVLAQHHRAHQLISVCIADNGIGIGHSLRTGPQGESLDIQALRPEESDHRCIELALKPNTSGAIAAPLPTSKRRRRYSKGARKGNGLDRVRSKCKELHIPLTILSHHGLVILGRNGQLQTSKSFPGRLFAGTLYHMSIPTR